VTAPGQSFGPYTLLERLGEGGMATVWAARKQGVGGFERVVCIKRIRADQRAEPAAAQRFLQEARLLGRLHHANIAQIYDAGEIDGEYFIEMEILRGKDLRTLMKDNLEAGLTPPLGLGVAVATTVGRALDHAHQLVGADGKREPIIHRDVTAANIILCTDGAVKLLDFGLAKAVGGLNPKLTGTGVLVGTIGYIAPEVQRGGAASEKSDQFSLGVILYETVTGRRLLDPIVARERPPSKCDERIPAALDPVCLRALAEKPEDRYPSCGAFVTALEAAAPNVALTPPGIAAYVAERNVGKVLSTPKPAPAPIVDDEPTQIETFASVGDVATVRTPPRTSKRRAVVEPHSNLGAYVIAFLIVAISVGGALGYRWWRMRTPDMPTVPAPVPQVVESNPHPPEPVAAPPEPSMPESHHDDEMKLVAPRFDDAPKSKHKKRRGRGKDHGEDMQLVPPKF
jgi:serine/threonine protein kinase